MTQTFNKKQLECILRKKLPEVAPDKDGLFRDQKPKNFSYSDIAKHAAKKGLRRQHQRQQDKILSTQLQNYLKVIVTK